VCGVAVDAVGSKLAGETMTQPMLFDELGEPELAVQAVAVQAGAGRANRNEVHRVTKPTHSGQRLLILKHIERMATAGATRDEIADALNLPVSTVCGRVSELLDPRWPDVAETNQRRLTRYGKSAVVVVSAKHVLGS